MTEAIDCAVCGQTDSCTQFLLTTGMSVISWAACDNCNCCYPFSETTITECPDHPPYEEEIAELAEYTIRLLPQYDLDGDIIRDQKRDIARASLYH